MRRWLTILLVVGALGLIGSALNHSGYRVPPPIIVPDTAASSVALSTVENAPLKTATSSPRYTVDRVVDGDTIVVDIDGTSTTLRLIGMDTPETVDPRKPVECFGQAASDEAHRLLDGTRVAIEYDPSQGMLDAYGRTLAYIYMEDGTLYNEYMIAQGFAHEYTFRLPYTYQTEFKAAEADARASHRGLWADSSCAAESAR